MSIKSKIKEARKKAGISQRELGRRIDKTGQYISYLENDDNSNPSYEVLRDISKALNISIEKLVGSKKSKKEYNFNFNKIVDLTYDMFEEVYYHSKLWLDKKDPLSPKEFHAKDKYFIMELSNQFRDLIVDKMNFQDKRIKEGMLNEKKSQVDDWNNKQLSYAPMKTEDWGENGKITSARIFELGDKLNDKKYLKYKIEEFKSYLENVENGIDNYKIIEENLQQLHNDYLSNKKDDQPREATQKDFNDFFGR